MAKRKLKDQVIKMRKLGMSYSQILNSVSVSKSTLSLWLRDIPLSQKQIVLLRDKNPVRIEKFKNTMEVKRNEKMRVYYEMAKSKIGNLSERDKLIAGIFLYFGDGSKTTSATTAVTNTNPVLVSFFMKWLIMQGAEKKKIRIKLQLYEGMDISYEINFWCKELGLTKDQIRGPYVKKNIRGNMVSKGVHGHGTCTILYENMPMLDTVLAYLKYVEDLMS